MVSLDGLEGSGFRVQGFGELGVWGLVEPRAWHLGEYGKN